MPLDKEYKGCWKRWIELVDSYEVAQEDYLRFFAPILREVVDVATDLSVHGITSHMALCVSRESCGFPNAEDLLYLIPVIGEKVFITRDSEATLAGKTEDALARFDGEMVSEENAPDRIIHHLHEVFGEPQAGQRR